MSTAGRLAELGTQGNEPQYLAACQFVHGLHYREMKTAREIEILFRRLRLYDRLERRAEGLVRTIQRVMKERYGPRSRPFRNRAHARPSRKTATKTHVRVAVSHGRPIQSPTQIMIADMKMTVRSMVSH